MQRPFYCTYTCGNRYEEIHPTGWQRASLEEAQRDVAKLNHPDAEAVVSYDGGITWERL